MNNPTADGPILPSVYCSGKAIGSRNRINNAPPNKPIGNIPKHKSSDFSIELKNFFSSLLFCPRIGNNAARKACGTTNPASQAIWATWNNAAESTPIVPATMNFSILMTYGRIPSVMANGSDCKINDLLSIQHSSRSRH